MREAREKHDNCLDAVSHGEAAINTARPEQVGSVKAELLTRRAEFQKSESELESARTTENALQAELSDQEAAFAQDEILEFITKRKYTLNPWNLSNAMAGLPYATEVPFLGIWVSHERCSALDTTHWPNFHYQVFEKIELIYNRSLGSQVSPVDFFRQAIKDLPKVINPTIPQEKAAGATRIPNSIRKHLADNFCYLRRAIENVPTSTDDPRPQPFIICSTFNRNLREPRSAADEVLAATERIQD